MHADAGTISIVQASKLYLEKKILSANFARSSYFFLTCMSLGLSIVTYFEFEHTF